MRKMYLSLAIILLFGLSLKSPAQISDSGKKFSLVEIKVPYTEVYDDGIYRKLYSSFQIFDEKGNKVIGLSQKYDCPAKIKLPEGKYTFIVILSNEKVIEKDITVVGNQFEVIQID